MKTNKTKILSNILRYAILIVFSMIFFFPFYWMFVSSIKYQDDLFAYPPVFIPNKITFQNYIDAWTSQNFTRYTCNTLIITVISVIVIIFVSALVAYGFSRYQFKFKNVLFSILLATMILPDEVLIIPRFLEFNEIGWINTFLPILIPGLGGSAYFIFLMRQYMGGIPRDLDEAANIDGCGRFNIFAKIIFPLLKPIIATCVVFQFMASWNDYLWPLIYLRSPDNWTLSLGIAAMFSEKTHTTTIWGQSMAMASFFSFVPLLVFFFAQKKLIGGIATSGIKS